MDFGKFQYERAKKERDARKAQKQIEVKEVRLRPKTGEHDVAFKVRDARRFISEGNKVKIRIRFRGREMAHPELGLNILERLAGELEELATIENQPKLEGRNMHMLISPLKKAPEKAAKSEDDEAATEAAATELGGMAQDA